MPERTQRRCEKQRRSQQRVWWDIKPYHTWSTFTGFDTPRGDVVSCRSVCKRVHISCDAETRMQGRLTCLSFSSRFASRRSLLSSICSCCRFTNSATLTFSFGLALSPHYVSKVGHPIAAKAHRSAGEWPPRRSTVSCTRCFASCSIAALRAAACFCCPDFRSSAADCRAVSTC